MDPGEAYRTNGWHKEVLDTAPDAMLVVASDGKIVYANRQTGLLFGWSTADLLGRPLEVLIPERLRASHRAHVGRFFESPKSRPMGSGIELVGLHRSGRELAIEVSLSPVKTDDQPMVSAAIRDISERKRHESATRLLASRLASAVESVQDSFALFDADHRLALCNSAYRMLVGESLPGPIVGRTYQELLDAWIDDLDFADGGDARRFRAERMAKSNEPSNVFEVRTKGGQCLRVTDKRTAEGGIVRTVWDLSDDVRLAEELRAARSAAEAASAAKSEFLSSMSHELRTPLNAILGFTQLLQRDKKEPLSARHRERVDQIQKSGDHLLRLIDDILDLSRIESSGISIFPEPLHLRDVLRQVHSSLEPIATNAELTLTVEELPDEFPNVVADPIRLAQILMNFGSNAVKYNKPSGTIAIAASKLGGDRVRVSVSDTGIGIAPDKQNKLFQPFQRAGQETGPIEGTGIGLVISKRLAELMHGSVGFRSDAGIGSVFWVDLPVPFHDEDRTAPAPTRDEPDLRTAEHRLVLYIEDNPASVLFMRDLLSAFENIEFVTTPSAELGIEFARASPPDVIIMDINLPGMSGLDALHVLRSAPETMRIPVVALTAAASDRDRRAGEKAGFHRYLTKPVNVDEFEAVLEKLFREAP